MLPVDGQAVGRIMLCQVVSLPEVRDIGRYQLCFQWITCPGFCFLYGVQHLFPLAGNVQRIQVAVFQYMCFVVPPARNGFFQIRKRRIGLTGQCEAAGSIVIITYPCAFELGQGGRLQVERCGGGKFFYTVQTVSFSFGALRHCRNERKDENKEKGRPAMHTK